jgi:predicted secreted Zn-dependent protease
MLGLVLQEADARLRVTENTRYFSVSGISIPELLDSLRRAHPNFDAETHWDASVNHTWRQSGKTCRMTSVDVSLKLTILLPKLATKVSPDVQARWDKFLAAVIVHENGHVRLYKSTAKDLDRSLGVLSRPCNIFLRDAAVVTQDGYKKMQRANDDYDAETDNGAKQGGTLF